MNQRASGMKQATLPNRRSWSCRRFLSLAMVVLASACQTPPRAPVKGADREFDWTLGTWHGTRRAADDRPPSKMTMRVEPVLNGAGQILHIEIEHDGGVYRGLAVQALDARSGRWTRQYVNETRGRFARLEAAWGNGGPKSTWISTTPGKTRESRLVSERLSSREWRRTMSISTDDGASWRVLWTDDLRLQDETTASPETTPIESVAIRVHRIDAMVDFYRDAFGARFTVVDTFGIKSRFATVGGITIKLVPIRDAVDFEGFPSHQLGFRVSDVDAAIALAVKYGGRQEGMTRRTESGVHAAVRDPDGNTIELYSDHP